ncbi:M20 family metallopeptidase [Bacillus manliponensis]|uniref:M20 metallopeptidase family protein n=1 Tax=Bacillus manliponensis TaxID=574376 RepID=UPI00351520D4
MDRSQFEWKSYISEENIQKWRRYLHQHPELSFQEEHTSNFVYETLCSFSYFHVIKPTKYSVMAVRKGNRAGKTIAIRADMDALPIQEETGQSYSSVVPGVMHACGHDAHTAILLGVAEALAKYDDDFPGEIRLFFQHAEEQYPGGGQEMVAAGVMDGVDYVIGLHVMSGLESGKVGITYGPMMASPDVFTIEVKGKGGHAAHPKSAVDPVLIGAQVVTNLQHLVSRRTDPFEQRVVSVTQFHSGTADNIIPETAHIMGTVRCFDHSLRQESEKMIEQIVKGITKAHDAAYSYTYRYGYHPVINDIYVTRVVEESARELFGDAEVVFLSPSMGGEDFSAYLQKAPGCFWKLGTKNEEIRTGYPHHHPKFDVDETALVRGAQLFLQATMKLLKA